MKLYSNKKAFSFVEIIIVISIVILLAVLSINMTGTYKEKANNAKIVSDTDTLKNSFLSYYEQNKTLPSPGGNNKYFKDDGTYGHSGALNNFGVAGFITTDILPKSYLNYLPLDPKTNQFYAYGKTLDNSSFEIASVVWKADLPETKLEGTYNGVDGTISLIREYNGPSFVTDRSKTNFPYNPEELLLTAKISSYAGTVKVNGTPLQTSPLLGESLTSGDTIIVPANGYAEIHFSDGSTSMLADTTESTLVLADMSYTQENNLATKIKLALTAGTLWTNASALDKDSEFDVFTQDASAAVRGTSFGVQAGTNSSNVTVELGSVDVLPPSTTGGIDPTSIQRLEVPSPTEPGQQHSPVGVNISQSGQSNPNTISRIENPIIYLNNIKPYILKQVSSESSSTITFENRDGYTYGKGQKIVEIKTTSRDKSQSNNYCYVDKEKLICNVTFEGIKELQLCKDIKIGTSTVQNCTQPILVSEGVNFERQARLGDSDNASLPPIICNQGKKGFYYGGPDIMQSECVDVDPALTASGFELVAYAPYNIEDDFNLYLPDGSTGALATHDKFKVGGLVLDASGTDGFLKYEGGELENIVNGDFAIEMSVRGNTLKTTKSTHYFHYFSDGNNYYYLDKFKEQLLLGYKNNNFNNVGIFENSNFISLNDKEFYKITTKYENNNWNFTIKNKDLINTGQASPTEVSNIKYIYIGSSLNDNSSLNGKINYIKLYKKTGK